MSSVDLADASFHRLSQAQDVSRSSVAALSFLAWDICVTTDDEVAHLWSTPWTWSKILYVVTRYYSLVALIVVNTHRMACLEWLIFEGISCILLELVVELILVLRLYAMYSGNRKVLFSMMLACGIEFVVMTTSLGVSIPKIMTSPGCIEASLPVEMIIYTIASILCESFLFGLAITRFIKSRRSNWGNVDLLNVLMRDSAWAFGILFCAMVANTLLFTLGPRTLASLGFPWLLAVLGSVGPRLFLNVRAVVSQQRLHSSICKADYTNDFYLTSDLNDFGDNSFPESYCDASTPLTTRAHGLFAR
ncbi:hypothetical protein BKA93DRAFT_119452 [Sparassis latifolia]